MCIIAATTQEVGPVAVGSRGRIGASRGQTALESVATLYLSMYTQPPGFCSVPSRIGKLGRWWKGRGKVTELIKTGY